MGRRHGGKRVHRLESYPGRLAAGGIHHLYVPVLRTVPNRKFHSFRRCAHPRAYAHTNHHPHAFHYSFTYEYGHMDTDSRAKPNKNALPIPYPHEDQYALADSPALRDFNAKADLSSYHDPLPHDHALAHRDTLDAVTYDNKVAFPDQYNFPLTIQKR